MSEEFDEKRDPTRNGRRATDLEVKVTSQWIQWIIGILVSIFIAISGYNTYRINEMAKDITAVRENVTKELSITKESVAEKYVTAREYGTLCARLDKMDIRFDRVEGKIDVLISKIK